MQLHFTLLSARKSTIPLHLKSPFGQDGHQAFCLFFRTCACHPPAPFKGGLLHFAFNMRCFKGRCNCLLSLCQQRAQISTLCTVTDSTPAHEVPLWAGRSRGTPRLLKGARGMGSNLHYSLRTFEKNRLISREERLVGIFLYPIFNSRFYLI